METQVTSEKMVNQLSGVRRKKIQKIKNKISSGKYRIDNVRLAKALFMAR
ncbi:MAG: flagellar biosynthesis anti-sigma factor FlgM [Deltaproteobacteria bacterium]|nr:flagellar biosynthesis anti-sigma factor FlgM [Deltaproteobacteria bacterium]